MDLPNNINDKMRLLTVDLIYIDFPILEGRVGSQKATQKNIQSTLNTTLFLVYSLAFCVKRQKIFNNRSTL